MLTFTDCLKLVQIAMRFAVVNYLSAVWQTHVSILQDWQGHCVV